MRQMLRPIVAGIAGPVMAIGVIALAGPRDAHAVDPPVPLPTLALLSPLPSIDLRTPLPSIDLGTPLPSIDLGTPLPSIDLGTPGPTGPTPTVRPTESSGAALPRDSEPPRDHQGGIPDGAALDRGPAPANGVGRPIAPTSRGVGLAPLRPFDPTLPGIGLWLLPAAVWVVPALVALVLAAQLAGGALGLRFVRGRLDRLASAAHARVRR